jgi:protoporphyrinogen oxidase
MSEGFNIANIAGGALVEQVDAEIQEVLKNIADPNTDWEKKRKIQINVVFEPDHHRDTSEVTFEVKAVLAPQLRQTTRIAFESNSKGKMIAEELIKGAMRGQTKIDEDTGEIIEPTIPANRIAAVK